MSELDKNRHHAVSRLPMTSCNLLSLNALLPTKAIRLISVLSPSLISNTTSTRFCGSSMIFGSTRAANRALRAYMSRMRCRSAWASAGVNTARGFNCTSLRRVSSVSLWLPSKAIWLTIGFSLTLTTSADPSRRIATSLNRPVA